MVRCLGLGIAFLALTSHRALKLCHTRPFRISLPNGITFSTGVKASEDCPEELVSADSYGDLLPAPFTRAPRLAPDWVRELGRTHFCRHARPSHWTSALTDHRGEPLQAR